MVAGRVEARMTVPVGGASFSACNGALAAAVAGTIPAGNYYPTAAGGVSGLLSTFQQYLNDNVQGYPTAAAAMQAAIGGNWTNGKGWLCNEASGNLAAAFGATTLTATSLTYGTAGPAGGIDRAVGFDATTDNADGGNIFDVTATDDLIVAWVGYLSAAPGGSVSLVTKFTTNGWTVNIDAGGSLNFHAFSGGVQNFVASVAAPLAGWYVGIATIDRATGKSRVATRTLAGVSAVSAEQTAGAVSYTTAGTFRLGQRSDGGNASTGSLLAAVYAVSGSGVAAGVSANLPTAITNFANAVSAQWSVALDPTTGRATIVNSFWPSSVAFTNPTLRDVLGFEYDFDYPQTAAQMQRATSGTWTGGVGYLCNEASGNLSPIFGSGTLTASGSPTYSNVGARGGNDKAIGFALGNNRFDGGSMLDLGASDDIIIAWAGRCTGAGAAFDQLFSKVAAAFASGWSVCLDGAGTSLIFGAGAGGSMVSGSVALSTFYNEQHVGIAVIDRSTGKIRVALQGLRSGTQSISTEGNISGSLTTAATFRFGASAWIATAPSTFTFSAFYAVSGSGIATGLSANLSTALSTFAAYMKGQTGTAACRGLWIPDHPLNLEGDPKRAPLVSDARSSMSPTGQIVTLVGNTYRRHRNLVWSHVSTARVWDGENTLENSTWEEFFAETQLGLGSSWFTPGSPIQIYYSNAGTDALLGADATIPGWSIVGLRSIEPKKAVGDWTGYWRIEIPQLIAAGS